MYTLGRRGESLCWLLGEVGGGGGPDLIKGKVWLRGVDEELSTSLRFLSLFSFLFIIALGIGMLV